MNRRRLEIALVLATGIGHYVFRHILGIAAVFLAATVVFWTAYVALALRRPGQAAAWGMRRENLGPSLAANLALVVVAGAIMAAWGRAHGRGVPSAAFFGLLLLYPIWGFIQQLLVCAIAGQAIEEELGGRRGAAIGIGASIFGLIHAPDPRLVVLTTVAGAVWMAFFFRWRNLWAHAIGHGWLAAIAYFHVLGRDPWEELRASLVRAGVL